MRNKKFAALLCKHIENIECLVKYRFCHSDLPSFPCLIIHLSLWCICANDTFRSFSFELKIGKSTNRNVRSIALSSEITFSLGGSWITSTLPHTISFFTLSSYKYYFFEKNHVAKLLIKLLPKKNKNISLAHILVNCENMLSLKVFYNVIKAVKLDISLNQINENDQLISFGHFQFIFIRIFINLTKKTINKS